MRQAPMRSKLTLVALATAALPSFGQFVNLVDSVGDLVNGGHLVHVGNPDDPMAFKVGVLTVLNGGEARTVNVRRYEIDVQPGTYNYFCWGVCYGPEEAGAAPMWQSMPQHSKVVAPDDTLHDFAAYHMPQGLVGNSTYRFVWFDVANPEDTAWVDIEFQSVAGTGVADLKASSSIALYPNPSVGQDVQLKVDLAGSPQGASVVIYSMLGERIRTMALRGNEMRATLSTGTLPTGVYFVAVERNGRALTTSRLVVTR